MLSAFMYLSIWNLSEFRTRIESQGKRDEEKRRTNEIDREGEEGVK